MYNLLRPQFFEAIVSFHSPPPDVSSSLSQQQRNAIDFTLELQRLFAGLHFTQRRYLDPLRAVNSLFKFLGSEKDKKLQHDATEFNELMLEALQKSIEIGPNSKELIKTLFYGSAEAEIHALDSTGRDVLVTKNEEFSHIIVDIHSGNLMSAIDNYAVSALEEWRIPDTNFSAKATKLLSFQRFPDVICFQLQRVHYDKQLKQPVKNNNLFIFDSKIYMDRYLMKNKASTKQRREKQSAWEAQRNKLQQELDGFLNFQSKNVALDTALEASSQYFQQINAENQHNNIISALNSEHERIKSRISQLQTEISVLNDQIGHLYDDQREVGYQLFAVLIHDGKNSGEGHYWSYIYKQGEQQWYTFNDANVQKTSEETVKIEGQGGRAGKNGSAYFLVYTAINSTGNVDNLSEQKVSELFPASVKQEISKDNEKFEKELAEWDKQQEEKAIQLEGEKLFNNFNNLEREVKESEGKSGGKGDPDMKLKSLVWFLHKLAPYQRPAQLQSARILMNNYKNDDREKRERVLVAFANKLKSSNYKDIGIHYQQKPTAPAANGSERFPVTNSEHSFWDLIHMERDMILNAQSQWESYSAEAEMLVAAITCLHHNQFYTALIRFIAAITMDLPLSKPIVHAPNAPTASRKEEIQLYLKLTIWLAYSQIKEIIKNTENFQHIDLNLFKKLQVLALISSSFIGGQFLAWFQSNLMLFVSVQESRLGEPFGGEAAKSVETVLNDTSTDATDLADKSHTLITQLFEVCGAAGNMYELVNPPPVNESDLYSRFTQATSQLQSSCKNSLTLVGKLNEGNADDEDRAAEVAELKKIELYQPSKPEEEKKEEKKEQILSDNITAATNTHSSVSDSNAMVDDDSKSVNHVNNTK
jgi:hypothetical protein